MQNIMIRHLNEAQKLFGEFPDVDLVFNWNDVPEWWEESQVYREWDGEQVPPVFGYAMAKGNRQIGTIYDLGGLNIMPFTEGAFCQTWLSCNEVPFGKKKPMGFWR